MSGDVRDLVAHLFRHEAGRIVARLVRLLGGRLDVAEDAVQFAMVQALRSWPFHGVPDEPRAWLARVAHNQAIDILRSQRRGAAASRSLHADAGEPPRAALAGELEDDRLALFFACAHPIVPHASRVALTLNVIGGFSVREIARAFVADPGSMAQRLVRAKRLLAEHAVSFEVPAAGELDERLDSVLQVIYLLFNEGYDATGGEEWVRGDLCAEAVRLVELVVAHPATATPAAHALAALLHLLAARLPGRLDPAGALILLGEQDRSSWDQRAIAAGMRHLARAARGDELTRYHLQAEIAALHVAAAEIEWARVVALYDQLMAIDASPVIALARAVAVAEADGRAAGLAAVAELEPALAGYLPFHAVRGELLRRAGDPPPPRSPSPAPPSCRAASRSAAGCSRGRRSAAEVDPGRERGRLRSTATCNSVEGRGRPGSWPHVGETAKRRRWHGSRTPGPPHTRGGTAMNPRSIRHSLIAAAVMLAASGCALDEGIEDEGALDETEAVGEGDAELEDGEPEAGAAAASCAQPRTIHCHETDNNCTYPEARQCDPVPRALDRVSRTTSFPINGTGHVLENGLGEVLGVVTATSTRLNWGQRRNINSTTKVMAFAVATTAGVRSGWINQSAIGRDLSFMPTVRGRDPGGSYSTWHIVPSDNSPYLDSNGNSLKVVRTCGSGRNATDYLNRNGHINLVYNLPGYNPALGAGTIDTYPNDRRILFRRAQSQLSIKRPLYSCASGSPVKTDRTLSFLYGYVEGASLRHGWMAQPNLRPGE